MECARIRPNDSELFAMQASGHHDDQFLYDLDPASRPLTAIHRQGFQPQNVDLVLPL